MYIAKNNDLIILAKDTREELEQALKFAVYTSIEETDIEYQLYNGEYLTADEIAQQEAERVSHLKCTKRVFILMLEQLGLDYFEQIEPLINANRQAKLEWELCVELERNNPLLNAIGGQLGITPAQIDDLFKYANGEINEL